MMISKYVAYLSSYSWMYSMSRFKDGDSPSVVNKYQIPQETLDNKPTIKDCRCQFSQSSRLNSCEPRGFNEICEYETNRISQFREPLQFQFTGYSIWLELEEESSDFDLSKSIVKASQELGLLPIPKPHVTAIYGMKHLPLDDVVKKWDLEVKSIIKSWPEFLPIGLIVDIERAGIDNGTMDMAWAEITYKNSPEHELKLNTLRNIFFQGNENEMRKMRPPWQPHLSLAYDNPDNTVLSFDYINSLIHEKPTLTKRRKVKGISLWSTWGKMSGWKLLDRYDFNN